MHLGTASLQLFKPINEQNLHLRFPNHQATLHLSHKIPQIATPVLPGPLANTTAAVLTVNPKSTSELAENKLNLTIILFVNA
jgi:hypothetical protein